jgi:hypothetical protein
MTSLVGLSAVLANVVVLLVLAAAVATPRMSRFARLVISTFGFLCAWLVVATLDAVHAPKLTVFMGGAVIMVGIAVVVATLHLWTQSGDVRETHPAPGDGEGGDGPRRHSPDPPRPGGGERDPSWWPEFERRFALYVAEREPENRQTAVLPTEPERVTRAEE